MATVTLAESAKLCQDMLVQGVIENIVTVNRFFEVFPFREIDGNALAYNRENVAGDVETLAVGGTISAKAAATFTAKTATLTKILGDAEVDYLIQGTRSGLNDQKAIQIASKAKSVARKYQDQMINGAGSGADLTGLLSTVSGGQTVTAGTGQGADLSFDLLDQLLDKVTDKDGQVDYIMMHRRTIRAYYALLRALGGASIGEVVTLPSGNQVPGYRGIPIFANDWIPITQTTGSVTTTTTVFAGTLDDGSMQHGIAGLTAAGDAGIRIQEVGAMENQDSELTRVKFYCGLACFSDLGLAALVGVKN